MSGLALAPSDHDDTPNCVQIDVDDGAAECPHCSKKNRFTDGQFGAAAPAVRVACTHCSQIFRIERVYRS